MALTFLRFHWKWSMVSCQGETGSQSTSYPLHHTHTDRLIYAHTHTHTHTHTYTHPQIHKREPSQVHIHTHLTHTLQERVMGTLLRLETWRIHTHTHTHTHTHNQSKSERNRQYSDPQ